MFTISTEKGLSLRALAALHRGGVHVSRSAHLGNQYLSNLLLASYGLPLELYDRTILGSDGNYHPAFIVTSSGREQVAEPLPILTPHGSFSDPNRRICDATVGATPANMHFNGLRTMYGDQVTTSSQVMVSHIDQVEKVIWAIVSRNPGMLDRYVMPCGCVAELVSLDRGGCRATCKHTTVEVDTFKEKIALTQNMMVDLASSVTEWGHVSLPTGPLPALPLVMILHALAGYWRSGMTRVYELSGPDMVVYAQSPELQTTVQEVYRSAAPELRKAELIPSGALELAIVPTAGVRFGYLSDGRGQGLVDACAEIFELSRVGGADWRAGKLLPQLLPLLDRVAETEQDLDIFYSVGRQETYFSQYDLIGTGRSLVVHPAFESVSMGDCQALVELIRKTRRTWSGKGKRERGEKQGGPAIQVAAAQ